jgi:hypothetical protein
VSFSQCLALLLLLVCAAGPVAAATPVDVVALFNCKGEIVGKQDGTRRATLFGLAFMIPNKGQIRRVVSGPNRNHVTVLPPELTALQKACGTIWNHATCSVDRLDGAYVSKAGTDARFVIDPRNGSYTGGTNAHETVARCAKRYSPVVSRTS